MVPIELQARACAGAARTPCASLPRIGPSGTSARHAIASDPARMAFARSSFGCRQASAAAEPTRIHGQTVQTRNATAPSDRYPACRRGGPAPGRMSMVMLVPPLSERAMPRGRPLPPRASFFVSAISSDSPREGDGFEPSVPRVIGAWGIGGGLPVFLHPGEVSSYQTPRWRKKNSNPRSRVGL
jgi:hypothetical protein